MNAAKLEEMFLTPILARTAVRPAKTQNRLQIFSNLAFFLSL